MDESYNNMSAMKDLSLVPVSALSGLSRGDTLKVLSQIESIVKQFEKYNNEIETLPNTIAEEKKKAEIYRITTTKEAKKKFWLIVIVSAIIGTIIVPGILTIVFGIVAWIIADKKVIKADLQKHEKENNAAVENYVYYHVKPLQERLETAISLRDELMHGRKLAWAIDVVGEELFDSSCISDLYNIVKSRRADNIKEALNKYDEITHRRHMEEMQQSIQMATEVSAIESIKQTEISKKIEENTYQTSQAVKVNAAGV